MAGTSPAVTNLKAGPSQKQNARHEAGHFKWRDAMSLISSPA
jgi:hypothetical protein